MIIEQGQKLEWKNEWITGDPKLDVQHKCLVKIINSLDTYEAKQNSRVFAGILSELTDYIKEHHKTEETIMGRYHYPFLKKHMEEHLKCVLQISRFNFMYSHQVPTTADVVFKYVCDWFINHEMVEDKKWRDFINKASG